MKTSIPNIFAAGDVTGVAPFAHVAIMQGFVAGENASDGDASLDYKTVPYCAFTRPEVMSVGLSEGEAVEGGYDVAVVRLPLSVNAAARARRSKGFVKLVVEREYGGILGIHAVGLGISELANEASLALSLESTAESLAYAFHAHPTLGEALRDAAVRALRLSG
jgi:dihydrolipoamide dehydrogenase